MSRVVIVSAGPFTGQIGGGQSYTQDMVRGLTARHHEVVVVEPVARAPGDTVDIVPQDWQGVRVFGVRLPLADENLEDQYTGLGARRVTLFQELLAEIAPDAVQVNGLMATAVRACNRLGLHHVVVAHHPGEACPKGDLLRPDDSVCTLVASPSVCGPCVLQCKTGGLGVGKLLAGVPYPLLRNVGRRLAQRNPFGYAGRVLYIPWLVEQRLVGIDAYLREARLVVSPSRALAATLVRNGARAADVRVVAHGIGFLPATPLSGLPARPLRFGFVGRIDHAKGLHVLLRAMQQASLAGRAELHVFGAPTNAHDRTVWEKALARVGRPPWLFLHGSFTREQTATVLAAIDVLVLPAICPESFGLVVAEALSVGRPVITTNIGGQAEQITEGLDGWLIEPNDVRSLAAVLAALAAHPEAVQQMALTAGRGVKPHQRYIEEMARILEIDTGGAL